MVLDAKGIFLTKKFKIGVSVLSAAALMSVGIGVNANEADSYRVNLVIDGKSNYYETTEETVGLFFEANGIEFDDDAAVSADEDDEIYDEMRIVVNTNDNEEIIYSEILNYKTVIEYSDELLAGESEVKTEGRDGKRIIKKIVKYSDGNAQEPEITEEITDPIDQVVVVGTKVAAVPNTKYEYSEILDMEATAYASVAACCGKDDGITANGSTARKGIVAVDPEVIPLGTKLYIPNYGICTAADTGGAIKGNKIDLCFNTYEEAAAYGRHNIQVYVLK